MRKWDAVSILDALGRVGGGGDRAAMLPYAITITNPSTNTNTIPECRFGTFQGKTLPPKNTAPCFSASTLRQPGRILRKWDAVSILVALGRVGGGGDRAAMLPYAITITNPSTITNTIPECRIWSYLGKTSPKKVAAPS